MGGHLKVEWVDGEREVQCPADPALPDGVPLVEDPEASSQCVALLPYPAPRCGLWVVSCEHCRKSIHITADGRADDPRSISVACRRRLVDGEAREVLQ